MLKPLRLQKVWLQLTGNQDYIQLFDELCRHYSEADRHYHNAQHIADCLNQFDLAQNLAMRPDEVEMAIWFHDAIYDPQAKDNEQQSAAWATQVLVEANVNETALQRIEGLILATRHTIEPATTDEKLIVDIDLSILGREPEAFARYDQQIRQEYDWVPTDQYRAGRTAILHQFLQRQYIYSTEFFRKRYEVLARMNISEALARLT